MTYCDPTSMPPKCGYYTEEGFTEISYEEFKEAHKVIPPSKKLQAVNAALARMPIKQIPVSVVRAQVVQHLAESRL